LELTVGKNDSEVAGGKTKKGGKEKKKVASITGITW